MLMRALQSSLFMFIDRNESNKKHGEGTTRWIPFFSFHSFCFDVECSARALLNLHITLLRFVDEGFSSFFFISVLVHGPHLLWFFSLFVFRSFDWYGIKSNFDLDTDTCYDVCGSSENAEEEFCCCSLLLLLIHWHNWEFDRFGQTISIIMWTSKCCNWNRNLMKTKRWRQIKRDEECRVCETETVLMI